MTLPILLDREPVQMVAGDSLLFAKAVAGVVASDGWALAYRLVGPLGTTTPPAGSALDVVATCTAVGAGWTVSLAGSDTAAVIADGSYRLVGRATNAGTAEKRTVYDAVLRVLANPMTATTASLQTRAEKNLEIIDAAIAGRLTADVEHYQIDGKVVGNIAIRDLHRLRGHWADRVWLERHPGQARPGLTVRFR